ncbi:hypothetical protein ACWGE1_05860 [Streptomyces sp. NPDC054932]
MRRASPTGTPAEPGRRWTATGIAEPAVSAQSPPEGFSVAVDHVTCAE